MTMERAAELVAKMRGVSEYAAQDLFSHFVDVFKLTDPTAFAVLCGYAVATDVRPA